MKQLRKRSAAKLNAGLEAAINEMIPLAAKLVSYEKKRFSDTRWTVIRFGQKLLMARSLYGLAPDGRRDSETGKLKSGDGGYRGWLTTHIRNGIITASERTCWNYINAALNAGLSHDSTASQINAAEKRDDLRAKCFTELYAPMGSAAPKKAKGGTALPDDPVEAAKDYWAPVLTQMELVLTDKESAIALLPATGLDPSKGPTLQLLERKAREMLAQIKQARIDRGLKS